MRRLRFSLALAALLLGACASHGTKPGATPTAEMEGEAPPGAATAAASSSAEAPAPDGGVAGGEAPSGPSLPEVKVESIGMHVGGGANDPASKEPFQRALGKQFPELLRCYRLIEEPKSGSFGVDLHIPRGGGKPRVEQPRTVLRGDAFKSCVIRAFENTEFEKTKLPMVISYSVKFSISQ